MSYAFKNGSFVEVGTRKNEVRTLVADLSSLEKQQVMKACLLQSGALTPRVKEVMRRIEAECWQALAITELASLGTSIASTGIASLNYKTTVREDKIGSVTQVAGEGNGVYVWGSRGTEGKMDPTRVVADMAACAFKPEGNSMVAVSFQKGKEMKNYHPSGNLFSAWQEIGEGVATEQGLSEKMYGIFCKQKEVERDAVLKLVQMAPAVLPKGRASRVRSCLLPNERTMLIKAAPTCANLDGAKFEEIVVQINKISPSAGSAKTGFGRIASHHYDGNTSLSRAQRKKQEFVDDYMHHDVDVYLLDTSDSSLVCAMASEIDSRRRSKDPYAVVYTGGDLDKGYRDVFATDDKGRFNVIGVAKKGIVRVPKALWTFFSSGVSTYYVAFNTYKVGGRTAGDLFTSSRESIMQYQLTADMYTHHAFYSYVGAMKEGDLVTVSVAGRLGRVIYHDGASVGRLEAVKQIFTMARHSILFPWTRVCYTYTKEGVMQYPGARPIKGSYDFSLPSKESFITSLTVDEMIHDIVGDEAFKLYYAGHQPEGEETVEQFDVNSPSVERIAPPGDEGEEREEEEDDDVSDLFSSIDMKV
jgi:hypothetical protein